MSNKENVKTTEEKSSSYKTSYAPTNGELDTITIDLKPFLLPISLIISSLIIGVSMYVSAAKIANGEVGLGNGNRGVEAGAEKGAAPKTGTVTPTVAAAAPENTNAKTTLDDDTVLGNKSTAKIAIVEFSDYECPFCKRFRDETFDQLKKDYIDTGKAVFVYRDLPLPFHENAQIQAEGAECAGEQGKYFEMFDKIYQKDGQLDKAGLITGAGELGLNVGNFTKCLDDGQMKAEVEKDAKDASAAGISGTPGFVVGKLDANGNVDGEKISGALPFASFKTVIEKYLK